MHTPSSTRLESRRGPRALMCAVALGAATILAPQALAQSQLSCAIVSKPDLTSSEEQQVVNAADRVARVIGAGTPSEVQQARADALRPFFSCTEQSYAFRVAYGRRLADRLGTVVTGDDVHRAVNALHAMGPVGIEDTVDLLADALEDERPGVRLGAATALGGTVQGNTGSSQLGRVAGRAATIGVDRFAVEDDPAVSAALVASLSIPATNRTLARSVADQMSQAFPTRLATLEPEEGDTLAWALGLSKASTTMRDAVLNLNGSNATDARIIRSVSRSSASGIGWALQQLDNAEDVGALGDSPAGQALLDLVRVCEVQIQRADQQLPGATTNVGGFTKALENAFSAGDAQPLYDAIEGARSALNDLGVGGTAFDLEP